jgi:DNA-binding transcriptional MocR family regulator
VLPSNAIVGFVYANSIWFLDGSAKIPPRLVDTNKELDLDCICGNTVSNGSFSKIITPGLRVLWTEGTSAFMT